MQIPEMFDLNPVEEAPTDNSLLRLYVEVTTEASFPMEDKGVGECYWTVGSQSDEGVWQILGWDWCQDCFVDADGTVLIHGWLPMYVPPKPNEGIAPPKRELFAIVDPNWGEPQLVTETITESADATVSKAIRNERLAVYSGYSSVCIPPKLGDWERLQLHGFRLCRIDELMLTYLTEDKAWDKNTRTG